MGYKEEPYQLYPWHIFCHKRILVSTICKSTILSLAKIMKRYIILTLIVLISYGCIRGTSIHFYNNTDTELAVVFLLADENSSDLISEPYRYEIANKGKSSLSFESAKSCAYRMPMKIFIIPYDSFILHRDDLNFLNEIVIQKYTITFNDFNYLNENECLTYPPTSLMKNVEMTPPWNQ